MYTWGGMIEERTGGTLPGSTTPDGSPFQESMDTKRADGGFSGRLLLSDTRSLSARASASVQGHEHLFGTRRERDRHTTGFAEVSLSGQDGDHVWVAGAAVQLDSYDATDVSGFDFDFFVPALFVQDEYAPLDWMTLAASARLDSHSEYGEILSPRVSLLLKPTEWAIRFSAGRGYFAPTPFTEETDAVGLGRLQPLAELVAERARSAMVDAGRVFGPVEVNLSAFASKIDHALVARPVDGGTLVLENSTGPVHTWGTEVLARFSQGPIRLIATHAYLRSTELDPTESGRREVPLTPRHSTGMVGAWEDSWGRAGLELYFTGRQELDENPYRSVSKPHFILGFLIDRRFGPIRLFLNAENILDTRQSAHDPLLRPAPTPDGRWVTDVWAPLDGRSFNGGIWINF